MRRRHSWRSQWTAGTLFGGPNGCIVGSFKQLLDAGCDTGLFPWLRVAGMDSPELNTPEGKAAAAAFTAEVLEKTDDTEVEVHGRSFNHWWVATVMVDDRDLAEVLIEAGHGAPCNG